MNAELRNRRLEVRVLSGVLTYVDSLPPLPPLLPTDDSPWPADLVLLINEWDRLPEAIKAGIMAMVRASSAGRPSKKPKDQKKPLRG
jgi:hypothetical protein